MRKHDFGQGNEMSEMWMSDNKEDEYSILK